MGDHGNGEASSKEPGPLVVDDEELQLGSKEPGLAS